MASKVTANVAPWSSGYSQLQSAVSGMSGWSSQATATITRSSAGGNNFGLLATDIGRAYACALYWKVTGSTTHADKALYYMNTWSSTLTALAGNIDEFLLALNAYQFANVGEIMRTYPGCSPANLSAFQTMMTLFSNSARDGLYGSLVPLTVYSSWQLSCIAALMAIGVLKDDTSMFNTAVEYFRTGEGNGCIKQAVYYLHPGYLGQTQESGRDQGHNTLSIGLMGVICEMAWNQGIDLYGYGNNRVLAACEYVAKGNMQVTGAFPTMPFAEYRVQGIDHTSFATGSQGQQRNEWAIVYNHYVNRKGLAAPYSKAFFQSRTETWSDNDLPGFGTLSYSRDAYTGAATPTGLMHYVSGGVVTLSWWGVYNATSYSVKRSTAPSTGYSTIGTVNGGSVLTWTDACVTPGTYYYVVTAQTASGETQASNLVKAVTQPQLLMHLPLDETSGTTAADTSGNALTSTVVSATRIAGRNGGQAVSLDGSTSYISLHNDLSTELGDCTIALWTYWAGQNNTREYLFSLGNGNDQFLVFCPKWSTGFVKVLIAVSGRDGDYELGTSSRLPSNQWMHVVLTLTANTLTLYYNGVQQAQINLPVQLHQFGRTHKNWLGRWGGNYYTGLIDDFRIYHGAMSASEVVSLYASS